MDAGDDDTLKTCRKLLAARRLDLAERELGRWLARHPRDAQGHALLAWCLALQERWDDAVHTARRAVRRDPHWAYTHATLGAVHLGMRDYRRAGRSQRRALALSPENPAWLAMLAAALLGRARVREALRTAEEGLEVEPEHAACARVRDLAQAALEGEDIQRVRERLHHALPLDPADAEADRPPRLIGGVTRRAAALVVQARAWMRPLGWLAAAYVAELALVMAFGAPNLPFLAIHTIAIALFIGGMMAWAGIRHPGLVAQMRAPGDAIALEAQRTARIVLSLAVTLLLLVPLVAMLIERTR